MQVEEVFDFAKLLNSRGILLCYSGYFSEKVLSGLGDTLKMKMAVDETDLTTSKKVFSVFVEQAQNIIRYSADRLPETGGTNGELRYGLVTIGFDNGRFFILGANRVLSSDVPALRRRLEKISTMDKDELRSFYKEKMRGPVEETSKGAGLGFIEIARRARAPVEFGFKEIDDGSTFFFLRAYI